MEQRLDDLYPVGYNGNMTGDELNPADGEDGDPPPPDKIVVRVLELSTGRSPFAEWFKSIKDTATRIRIQNRLARVRTGNPGDTKAVGGEVFELRLDFGPGYRIYFARAGDAVVVLLAGGNKHTQQADISRAIDIWKANKDNAERYLRGL